MVPTMTLLVPIVLSAVIVFVVSSVIHMILPYHRSDFSRISNEDQVMAGLREAGVTPGDYVIPCAGSRSEMQTPEFLEKATAGPVAFVTVIPSGPPKMGASLIQWFLYCVLISMFAAYVAGRALGPGAEYLAVFRFVGTTAFAGYGLALLQNSIWYKRAWSSTLKSVFDAFVYGLVTAGTFGWLWPS